MEHVNRSVEKTMIAEMEKHVRDKSVQPVVVQIPDVLITCLALINDAVTLVKIQLLVEPTRFVVFPIIK